MHITEIIAAGMNGQSFTRALTPCTLICGRNFAGKTTTLNAVRLAVLGYVPEVGKTNPDTAEMGLPLTVRAKFNTGDHLERRFYLKKGSVTEDADTSLDMEDVEAMACPCLDPAEYFDKTAGERAKYIFAKMKLPDTYSVDGILSGLHDGMESDNPLDPAAVAKAQEQITATVRRALVERGVAVGLGELTKTKGILPETLSAWNKAVAEKFGYVKTASQLKLRSGECSAETIAQLDAELARIDREAALANQAAGRMAEATMRANAVLADQADLQAKLRKLDDPAGAIEIAQEQLDEAKAKVVLTMESSTVAGAHYNAVRVDAREASTVESAAREIYATAKREVEEIDGLLACPHCNSNHDGWKNYLRGIAQEKLAAAASKVAKAEKIALATHEQMVEAETRYKEACTNDGVLSTVTMKERQIEELRRHQSTRENLMAELQRLASTAAPAPELQDAANQVAALRHERADVEARKDKAVELSHELARAAEASLEHAKALANQAVVKHALAVLKTKQAASIEALFKGLLETANYFARDILKSPIVYLEGEIGRMEGAKFVYKTLSGTEKGIIFIAIAAALSARSPFRLATIDEVLIDRENRGKIMRRLSEAIQQGIIDQAIMINTEPAESAGWSTINLTPEEAK